jgi:hypothetical protein
VGLKPQTGIENDDAISRTLAMHLDQIASFFGCKLEGASRERFDGDP